MSEQPEALRLADIMEAGLGKPTKVTRELRRLHEVNQELVEALAFLLTCKHGEFCDNYREAERKARAALARVKEEG